MTAPVNIQKGRRPNAPLDLQVQLAAPLQYQALTPSQRHNARLENDVCVIGDKLHLVRGTLEIPVLDAHSSLALRLWAMLEPPEFRRATAEGARPPAVPLHGWLASELPGYEHLAMRAVDVYVREAGRLFFALRPCDHPLYTEQSTGIDTARAYEIVRSARNP